MLAMLIAYDADGEIIATESLTTWVDADGRTHIIDVEAYEADGGKLRALWNVPGAVGSATWPEYLGERTHEFRVEVDKRRKLRAQRLVHKVSGHVRHRHVVAGEIDRRRQQAKITGGPADLRDLIGGPELPVRLDEHGRDVRRAQRDAEGRVAVAAPAFLRHAVKGPVRETE